MTLLYADELAAPLVRAGVRDVAKAAAAWTGDAHVQPVVFDFLDRASQDAALADCDSLFLLRPPQLNGDFGDLMSVTSPAWQRGKDPYLHPMAILH